ncbi:MAG: CHAT domain-containing protein, partial [Chlorobi bacterium]|nr:CHAT domain-containing protein [Chlorobiota bacterium]
YNLAIIYYNIGRYRQAVSYYQKSFEIKQKYHLKGIDKILFNLARTYEQLNKFKTVDSLFITAINIRKKNYGENYYRLAPFYLNYGNFLLKLKNYKQAKTYLIKAKNLYEKKYGFRHPYTANSYVYYGNYFSATAQTDSALYWYQKSLIADSRHFKSENIRTNPSGDDCFSKLQLLKGLKMKAEALICSAQKHNKLLGLVLSIKTSDAALHLIAQIRDEYISADNKLIITEIEKECYSAAVEASFLLYQKTNDRKYIYKSYHYVCLSKASLLNALSAEKKQLNAYISVSEQKNKVKLEQKIDGYKKLIYEENEKVNPDSVKIQFLQSKLFTLTNTYDNFITKLKSMRKITRKQKKNYLSVNDIQTKLPENTSLIEYFITKKTNSDKQDLYTFIIDKKNFRFFRKPLNKDFYNHIKFFEKRMNKSNRTETINSFNQFNKVCCDLYLDLFKQADRIIKNENIIIVPDEEIAFLSFDALQSSYKKRKIINYADLDYLIYKRCFSYAYSTPLLFKQKERQYTDFVYAFAPTYKDTVSNVLRQNFGNLSQTKSEINAILKFFKGKAYIGKEALEDSLKNIADKGGIIHIAGHASYEDKQKDFSFLAFSDKQKNSKDDGLLFAYEIETLNLRSPMVVLSACNTGRGRLYSGEGVYSLSRSFLTAGAASVVYSLWNVNDDAGSEIMTDFYKYLSENETKNTALRQAKLDYLKTASPMLSDPKYWGGYVLTGSVQSLKSDQFVIFLFMGISVFLFITTLFFLKRIKNRLKRRDNNLSSI